MRKKEREREREKECVRASLLAVQSARKFFNLRKKTHHSKQPEQPTM